MYRVECYFLSIQPGIKQNAVWADINSARIIANHRMLWISVECAQSRGVKKRLKEVDSVVPVIGVKKLIILQAKCFAGNPPDFDFKGTFIYSG